MREKVQAYLNDPSEELLSELTTMEQKWVKTRDKKASKKPAKVVAKKPAKVVAKIDAPKKPSKK